MQLTVFFNGGRWLLLNERGREVGAFEAPEEALEAARVHAQDLREGAYLMIEDLRGRWREVPLHPFTT